MVIRLSTLVLVLLYLSACGTASAPSREPLSLGCGATYTGHGVDTLNFSLTCSMQAPAHATSVTVTGQATGSGFTYTFCQDLPVASQGLTTCTATFVVIVPQPVKEMTVHARFSPGNEQLDVVIPVTIPQH
jgi:hypothetical protein